MKFWEQEQIDQAIEETWMPSDAAHAQEITNFTTDWPSQMQQRSSQAFELQTTVYAFQLF